MSRVKLSVIITHCMEPLEEAAVVCKRTIMESFDALLKVVIIGDSCVGKTCLILRYTQDIFRENFLSTIGVDFKTKTVDVGEKRFKLQIWDTAGQERYNTIRKGFYRGAKGVIVVYDITNPDSFSSLTKWIHDITNNCMDGTDRPAILVLGNKIDRESEREVATIAGEQAAQEFGTRFSEVSALTGEGVEEAFSILVSDIAQALDKEGPTEHSAGTLRLGEGNSYSQPHPKSHCPCT